MNQSIPTTMNAFVLTGHGGMDKLVWKEDWPVPTLGPNDVLIKVAACGLHNTDVNTRSGWYSKAVTEPTTGDAYREINESDPTWGGSSIVFPRIQGADVAGTVVAVGDAVKTDCLVIQLT
jgi:NADPH:quinone reductase-like Zn-dependent oxidoreductase